MPDDVLTLAIDGDRFTMDDLTFRERKEVRRMARELDGRQDAELEEIMVDDLIVAFVTVVKRRTDETYTTGQAMDLKPGDVTVNGDVPPTVAE